MMSSEGYWTRLGHSGCGKKVSGPDSDGLQVRSQFCPLSCIVWDLIHGEPGSPFPEKGGGVIWDEAVCGRRWEHSQHSLNVKAQTTSEQRRSVLLRPALLSAASSQA